MLSVKPHHFVDIITAYGDGRSTFEPHPYGHALHIVAEQILTTRSVLLRVELGADDICLPCRHNIDGRCNDSIDTSYRPGAPASKGEWNLLIDRRWCLRLGLQQGDELTARGLCERIREWGDDITEIYREIPAERTAKREAKLRRGIARFLAEERGSE